MGLLTVSYIINVLLPLLPKNHKMEQNNTNECFDGFEHTASEISKYLYSAALGLFTVALKEKSQSVNFIPENPDVFKAWFDRHKMPNIKDSL